MPVVLKKISLYQLGNRARKIKPKWYQFTRFEQVCPYCNNLVVIDKKSIKWLLLIFPLLLILGMRVLIGADHLPISPYNEVGFCLAFIGCIVSMFTMKLKKQHCL